MDFQVNPCFYKLKTRFLYENTKGIVQIYKGNTAWTNGVRFVRENQ